MLEYIGYLASIIILISLLLTSPKKFRFVNLLGGITFGVYGFLIGSIPVGVMNASISVVNIYYLYKMFNTKDYFKTLPIEKNSVYLKYFLKFYKDDINKYFPTHEIEVDNSDVSFYILRNVVPAGFFVGNRFDETTLRIDFDYVVPIYRDFKMGEYIYRDHKKIFIDKGYKSLLTFTKNDKHERYLKKMGFYEFNDLSKNHTKCYKFDLLQAKIK